MPNLVLKSGKRRKRPSNANVDIGSEGDEEQLGCDRICSIQSSLNMIRTLIESQKKNKHVTGKRSHADAILPGLDSQLANVQICLSRLRNDDKRYRLSDNTKQAVEDNFAVWQRVLKMERRRHREKSNGNDTEGMSTEEKKKLLSSVCFFAVRLYCLGFDPLTAVPSDILGKRK